MSARFCITAPMVSMAFAAFERITSVVFEHLQIFCFLQDFIKTAAPVPSAEPIIIPQAMYFARQDISFWCFVIFFLRYKYYVKCFTLILSASRLGLYMAIKNGDGYYFLFCLKISYASTEAALAAEREPRNSLP